MTGAKRKIRNQARSALVVATGLVWAHARYCWLGHCRPWARRTVIEQLEKTTGARVELGIPFFLAMMTAQFDRAHL